MDRRLLPVLAVLLLAPLPALADPGDDTEVEGIEPEQEPDIIGGTQAQTCQWPTTVLMQVADRHCDGRIVSLLEGGYDLEALADSVAAHVGAMMMA